MYTYNGIHYKFVYGPYIYISCEILQIIKECDTPFPSLNQCLLERARDTYENKNVAMSRLRSHGIDEICFVYNG